LTWTPAHLSFAEILHQAGAIPLPPYIKRAPVDQDNTRYQTVYSEPRGSVAAPTAGLHFTVELLDALRQKKIPVEYLTLHVGAGTFKPVKTETIGGHDMHREWIDVKKETIQHLLQSLKNRKIIAVGTTSLRTLESLYWLGVDLLHNKTENIQSENVDQWRPYQKTEENTGAGEALETLLASMEAKKMERIIAQTGLIIVPGYRFRIVQGLLTNFHQPQSTLLLLVAALVGDDWKKVYNYALENDFRFLSYGDGSLLMPGISSGEDQR
jgi:S-adenosylmethionine:tRNA ribosyltransferase-isomerase